MLEGHFRPQRQADALRAVFQAKLRLRAADGEHHQPPAQQAQAGRARGIDRQNFHCRAAEEVERQAVAERHLRAVGGEREQAIADGNRITRLHAHPAVLRIEPQHHLREIGTDAADLLDLQRLAAHGRRRHDGIGAGRRGLGSRGAGRGRAGNRSAGRHRCRNRRRRCGAGSGGRRGGRVQGGVGLTQAGAHGRAARARRGYRWRDDGGTARRGRRAAAGAVAAGADGNVELGRADAASLVPEGSGKPVPEGAASGRMTTSGGFLAKIFSASGRAKPGRLSYGTSASAAAAPISPNANSTSAAVT